MVKLQHPPGPQSSSLLTLPAEVRNQIWRLLFKDSRVVYKSCIFNQSLSTERYQIVHTCRFAYQETFALLWSYTAIKYIDCVPAPNSAGLKEQFAASAPCRKLIPRLEIEPVSELRSPLPEWPTLDLRGLRHFAPLKEVWIRPLPPPTAYINALFIYGQADFVAEEDLDLQRRINESLCRWLGPDVGRMLDRRNRKYRAFISAMVLDHQNEYVSMPISIEGR